MDHYSEALTWDRRRQGARNLVLRLLVKYHKIEGFLVGISAYPVGIMILSHMKHFQ